MTIRNTFIFKFIAFVIATQVFNISMNVSDNLMGKNDPGYQYVNEIETVVEFVAEVCLNKTDYIPETQTPGGSLGFEEEEKHLTEERLLKSPSPFVANMLYKKRCFSKSMIFENHITEVLTPPPEA